LSFELLSYVQNLPQSAPEAFDFVQDVVMGYPMVAVFAGLVVLGVVKKLVKLACFAGLLAVLWLCYNQM